MINEPKPDCFSFELFCIDPPDVRKEVALAQALSYSNSLWGGNVPIIDTKGGIVTVFEKSLEISLIIKPVKTSNVITDLVESAFLINATGSKFETIEPFRVKLLKHLRNTLQFKHIRLLTDEVSTYIAHQLYPEINKIETQLRKYLTKFFLQRVGFEWWETTATKAMIEKVRLRKVDRRDEISQYIDDDLRLIDFDDLGELIYKQTSGFNNPERVLNRLFSLKSSDDLFSLQRELQGNYTKYFKDNFQHKNFEQKWKELIKIRNKVAHQGTFFVNELNRGLEITQSLSEIIAEAELKIDQMEFTSEEKEAFRYATKEVNSQYGVDVTTLNAGDKIDLSYAANSNGNGNGNGNSKGEKIITEEQFISELEKVEKYNKYNAYIGLKWFVTIHLADFKYSVKHSYILLNDLRDAGKIEVYEVDSPNGWPVKAIRVAKIDDEY